MTDATDACLPLWGLAGAGCEFVAGRENRVYRLRHRDGDFALRIRRPGYRSADELVSELAWLDAMDRAGLQVPRPLPSRNGRLLEQVGDTYADVVGWLPGKPMGKSRIPLDLADAPGTFHALGVEMARLHQASDLWLRPMGFRRWNWDLAGLLGEAPLWGRFWENPVLDPDTRGLFLRFRAMAQDRLRDPGMGLDHGLIHADLVRENVLLDGGVIRMIDFDDGGLGYRQFDLATVLVKNLDEPEYPALRSALCAGYQSQRPINLSSIDLFLAIRALTYVGWIVSRMQEDGGSRRNAHFIAEARTLCMACLREAS